MVKRKAKKAVKKPNGDLASNSNCTNADEQPEIDKQRSHQEVERRIAACKAIRDAEKDNLLTLLHLLRSNFNNEQLQVPFLQFFQENLPNLDAKVYEKDDEVQLEVEWKDKDGNVSVTNADERNMHECLLQQISRSYPDFAAAGMPSVDGFEFSNKAAYTMDFLSAANFVMEEPSETQNLGLQNAFHTPGANSQRLSVGMTPKTLRLPKAGEMLLSVRGSPLGLYKDDNNMEAIHESEES
ncbi:translation initiation factor [Thalictrum thalictroides]|uniref:Translation initiation factor n=1 Tax=Thalictrum thalictroides TaxID=46969 RepID=A0A7J6X574_THATH|nr:translation initiation factor [Thalictrum thalictroides]